MTKEINRGMITEIKKRTNREIYKGMAIGCICLIMAMCFAGCAQTESADLSEAVQDAPAEKTVSSLPAEEEVSQNATLDIKPDMDEDKKMLKYESSGYELEYPASWEVKEEGGEDGNRINFYNEAGQKMFWIEQGEAWRADLNRKEEDYKELLSELYEDVEVVELSRTEVDGYEAQKLIFTFTENGEKREISKHILVAGYAFFETNYVESFDRMPENETGEKVVHSISIQ